MSTSLLDQNFNESDVDIMLFEPSVLPPPDDFRFFQTKHAKYGEETRPCVGWLRQKCRFWIGFVVHLDLRNRLLAEPVAKLMIR